LAPPTPSGGVTLGPLPGGRLVPGAVLLENPGDLGDKGVIGVWVGQQRADREEHLRDRQRGAPLVPKDVEADVPIGVDVGVVDPGDEVHLGGLERVVRGEGDRKEEHTPCVGGSPRADDRSRPLEEVLIVRARGAVRGRVPGEVPELLLDALGGHNRWGPPPSPGGSCGARGGDIILPRAVR